MKPKWRGTLDLVPFFMVIVSPYSDIQAHTAVLAHRRFKNAFRTVRERAREHQIFNLT